MKRLAFILSLILLFGPLALTTSAAQQNDSATQHRDSTQRDDSATQRRDSTVRRGNVGDREEAQEQTSKGARIFDEIMGIPEGGIPQSILDGAECIAVFPSVIKGGFFLFGGRGGKGLVSCRDTQTGTWGPPVFLKIGGGSFGPQIGGEAVDLILLVMNRSGAELFTKDRFQIGGEASAAAGPVGRTASASTDLPTIRSQILSYSRSRGLFAGLELKGSVIRQDKALNRAIYGRGLTPTRILTDGVSTPAGVEVLPQTLAKYSQRRAK